MPEKMTFEDMISLLDCACGMMIVTSMKNPEIKNAMEMITDVSLSLGEWAMEFEKLIEYKHMYEDLCK